MGEGKEGGRITVCEDDDDGAVFLGRWDDNEVRTQDPRMRIGRRKGRRMWYVPFLPGLSLFAIVLFLWVSLWLPGVSSGLPFFLFSVSLSCGIILVFRMLMRDHFSLPSRQS